MATLIKETVELEVLTCCQCGVHFAVPRHFVSMRRQDRDLFYCPSGHPQHFVRSEADKLRDELARERQRLDQASADAAYQRRMREAAERSASATRGQLTKIKNRVSKGVCPCCNRTFIDLQRHMASKHPGYERESAAAQEKGKEQRE